MNIKNITDHIGIVTSCVCVVHCVALPVLLVSSAFVSDQFHIWSLVATILITGHALWHGYKEHCKHIVLALGGLGLLSLFGGVALHFFGHDHHSFSSTYGHHNETFIIEHGEAIVTIIGSMLLMTAHGFNLKFKSKCCKS